MVPAAPTCGKAATFRLQVVLRNAQSGKESLVRMGLSNSISSVGYLLVLVVKGKVLVVLLPD